MILVVEQNRFAVGEALEKYRVRHAAVAARGARIGSRSPFCTIQVERRTAGVGDVIAVIFEAPCG